MVPAGTMMVRANDAGASGIDAKLPAYPKSRALVRPFHPAAIRCPRANKPWVWAYERSTELHGCGYEQAVEAGEGRLSRQRRDAGHPIRAGCGNPPEGHQVPGRIDVRSPLARGRRQIRLS
jgi:hypothetical protein